MRVFLQRCLTRRTQQILPYRTAKFTRIFHFIRKPFKSNREFCKYLKNDVKDYGYTKRGKQPKSFTSPYREFQINLFIYSFNAQL